MWAFDQLFVEIAADSNTHVPKNVLYGSRRPAVTAFTPSPVGKECGMPVVSVCRYKKKIGYVVRHVLPYSLCLST